MNSRVATISALVSAVTPLMIFIPRRINKCLDETNPVNAAIDLQVGAAQSANAFKGVVAASKYYHSGLADACISADEKIKNLSGTVSKTGNGIFNKLAKFTMNNVNKVIAIGEGVRVALFSDHKEHDGIIAAGSVGGMVLAERFGNNLMGKPKTKLVNGEFVTENRDAIYKKYPWLNDEITHAKQALEEFSAVEKFTGKYTKRVPETLMKYIQKGAKYLPSVAKGIIFASVFSIPGFYGGRYLSSKVADEIAPIKQAA